MPAKTPTEPFRNAARLAILRMRAERRRAALEEPWRPAGGLDADYFSRVFEHWRAIEEVSTEYYLAKNARTLAPHIPEGVVRDYAYVIGQTVTWRDKAEGPEYHRVHQTAILSYLGLIAEWRAERRRFGLPVEWTQDEIAAGIEKLGPERVMEIRRLRYSRAECDAA